MTTNNNRDCFQAQNKLENLVIEQMWQACYAALMDETENGFYMLWMDEKSVAYESDKEKAMQVLNEYGYKFPAA